MGRFGPEKRKIPVPKRHGVRDPLKKAAEKEAANKDKVNNPPLERDVQQVSNSVKRLLALASEYDEGAGKSKSGRRQKQTRRGQRFEYGNAYIHKFPKENEESFLQRMQKIQEDREVEAKFASKFNVEVVRNENTGEIRVEKRKGIDVDEVLRRKRLPAGRKNAKPVKPKVSLAQRKAEKLQKAKEKKRNEEDLLLNEYQYEHVPFGEVVKGPPTLNVKPRRADKTDGAPRPGQKRLLLHTLIEGEDADDTEASALVAKKSKQAATQKQAPIDLKGKRKKLPLAMRMKLEQEQENIVAQYRRLKKKS